MGDKAAPTADLARLEKEFWRALDEGLKALKVEADRFARLMIEAMKEYQAKHDPNAPANPAGGGRAIERDAAAPTRTPTPEQVKEIESYIEMGRQHLDEGNEASAEYIQKAIDKTVEYYGIDLSNVKDHRIVYNDEETADGVTQPDRSVSIGPEIFRRAEHAGAPYTAATIIHEVTHANQRKYHGGYNRDQDYQAREAMGYEASLRHADALGLKPETKELIQKEFDKRWRQLNRANRDDYAKGKYWGMTP